MNPVMLNPGDEFAAHSDTILGYGIRCVEKVGACDDESKYNHTGIIISSNGLTLESLWTVKSQNIWEAYKGKEILIVRNINMTQKVFDAGFKKVEKHIGQWYPVHRLALHFMGMAKWIHWKKVVYSELTAKFETGCAEYLGNDEVSGFMRNFYGVNPDDLTDRWCISRYYETVFEGVP